MMSLQRMQGTLAILIASVLLATGCSQSSATRTTTGATASGSAGVATESQADSGSPATVSAEELARDFKTDPAAADKKYKGHTLILEGKVHDVYDKNISGEPTLVLWGYREKPTDVPKLVQCFFPESVQGELKSYKKDQKVKIKGKGAGSIDTLHYQVKDCTFVK